MAGKIDSSASSPVASLSSSESATSSSAARPPPPPPPPPPAKPAPVKERKKPGPKPKPKIPPPKLSKIVKLKVSSLALRAFESKYLATGAPIKSTVSPPPGTAAASFSDASSAVHSEATNIPPVKGRGIPGPKPGSKRGRQPGALLGKPGRKKTKLDPTASPAPGLNGISHHATHGKLGPKANQGAINAQLRALDRTGKPCKRWHKAGFQLKSFTGVEWSIPTWAAPRIEKDTPPPPSTASVSLGIPEGGGASTAASPSAASDQTTEIKIHPDHMVGVESAFTHPVMGGGIMV